jgi:hypothetical protein
MAVTWEWMEADARLAYERAHGIPPPGFRGTGDWRWFARFHPDTAPCCKCGVTTDRWVVSGAVIKRIPWGKPHVDQPMSGEQPERKRALCWEAVWPFCQGCEDRASIAVLKVRQANPAIFEQLRVAEAELLQELLRQCHGHGAQGDPATTRQHDSVGV